MRYPTSSRRIGVGVALALLAPPVSVFYQTRTSLVEQGVASGGALNNAALYPEIVAGLLAILAFAQLILASRRPSGAAKNAADPAPVPFWMPIVGVLAFAIYLFVLPKLGYHLTTPPFILAMLMVFGVRLLPAIAVALGMSLLVAVIFEGILNVVLPVGMFDIALPV